MHPAILVADGTYIYMQKSQQFKFKRKCYSLHKHRPLVKLMVFVSTSGYIFSVIGLYYSDRKNNDAQILKHIIQNDIAEFKQWVCENDVIIVDHGFRDSFELLHEIGVRTEMPSFLKKGESQLPVEESNVVRLITTIRWIVESVDAEREKQLGCKMLHLNNRMSSMKELSLMALKNDLADGKKSVPPLS